MNEFNRKFIITYVADEDGTNVTFPGFFSGHSSGGPNNDEVIGFTMPQGNTVEIRTEDIISIFPRQR